MKAVTQWFDGSVKPVHVGPYQRKDLPCAGEPGTEILYWYWNGEFWVRGGYFGAELCCKMGDMDTPSPAQNNLPWRGLAQKPKLRKQREG